MAAYEMMHFNEQITGVIPLRNDLQSTPFTKSQRKLLRKNRKKFRREITPLNITTEKEVLYRKYKKARFPEQIERSLEDFFGHTTHPFSEECYDTWEINYYNNHNELVAVSYFDKGKYSLGSIMCTFDMAYDNDSLGFYSMLEEIEYARSLELRYYYAGYVLDVPSCFDYKLRLQNTQFYNWEGDWSSWKTFDLSKVYRQKLLQQLCQTMDFIHTHTPLNGGLRTYKEYFNEIWSDTFHRDPPKLNAPYFLNFSINDSLQLIVLYTPRNKAYEVLLLEYGFHEKLNHLGCAHNLHQLVIMIESQYKHAFGSSSFNMKSL
ncbi:hypothetical protein GCM10023331_34720 [Algivirga pacifica]|uniref:N-end rule aminoacyl transferase C-terminal domain-containing protein n=2 Tax=Algivirga pacifica TaxID=1162670 RepID=A0ABP9DK22_9BACT